MILGGLPGNGKRFYGSEWSAVREMLLIVQSAHGCIITLTVAKFSGSDLAAIQFLDRSFEELGII